MVSKKGSLELSIQAIIIVVIAFVVLGLGLGFVRSQFGSIQETTSSVQEQVRQSVLEDLRTGNKKLSFPGTSIIVEKGSSKDIAIGVKNTKAQDALKYRIGINVQEMQEGIITDAAELNDQVSFFYDTQEASLTVTEARVHSIRVGGKGVKGTYLVKLQIIDTEKELAADPSGAVYDEKTFFVTIA